MLLGFAIVGLGIYTKFAFDDYASLAAALPTGAIWYFIAFGAVLGLCSFVLIVSACCYTNGFFKIILSVFSIILMVLLLCVIAGAGVFIVVTNVLALPAAAGPLEAPILQTRDLAVNASFYTCCVEHTPPYLLDNSTAIIGGCLVLPEFSNVQAQVGCSDLNCTSVKVCGTCAQNPTTCQSDLSAYGSYWGLALAGNTIAIGISALVFGVLVLIAIIASCVLVCSCERKSNTYKSN
jgi:hypothetical protein